MTIEPYALDNYPSRIWRFILIAIVGLLLLWLCKILFGPVPLTPKQQYDGAKECVEKGEIPYVLEDHVRCKRY